MGSSQRSPWGRQEYDSATPALRATGYLGALKVVIGALCMSMVLLGAIVQFHPLGPHGLDRRLIHAAVLASAAVVGLCWMVRPWPSYRGAVAFVVWADLGVATDAALLSAPSARLCATIHMGLAGVFIAFLLGWRILAVHSAFAAATILTFTVWGVVGDHASLLDLYIFYAPALSSVVALPVFIQAVIEAGRRSMGRTAHQAIRDPLTGLLNRRGMHATVESGLSTLVTSTLMAVAVVDVDRFKELNDTHGHDAGDAALREVAHCLRGIIRHDGDLVARTGGDEFVLIVYLEDSDGLDSFVERCTDFRDRHALPVRTSIGIAWQGTGDAHFHLETLLQRADTAMYRAKRAGGDQLVTHTD